MLGGDIVSVDEQESSLGVFVVDVAGNGWGAAREAWRVRDDADAAVRLAPTAALQRLDEVMTGVRCAVGVAARFEVAGRLRYAGVGDVAIQRWRGGSLERLGLREGQLGGVCPRLEEATERIEVGDVYLVTTDGIRSGMTMPGDPRTAQREPQRLAEEILASWAREHDDATCVVVGVGP